MLGLPENLPKTIDKSSQPEEPLQESSEHHQTHDGGVSDLEANKSAY